jgi:hypothetical protein
MKDKIHILEDDDNNLNDDIAPEYDLEELRRRAKEEGREYQGIFSRRDFVRIDPEILEYFQTPEAINEALRRVMREMQSGG